MADANWTNLAVGDLNGDGRTDLVAQDGRSPWASISNGTGFDTSLFGIWDAEPTWSELRLRDIDHDGTDELFVIFDDSISQAQVHTGRIYNLQVGAAIEANWELIVIGDFDSSDM